MSNDPHGFIANSIKNMEEMLNLSEKSQSRDIANGFNTSGTISDLRALIRRYKAKLA